MPANWKQTKTQLNQHRSRLSASAAAAAAASLRPHSCARCELRLQLRRQRRQQQQRLRSSLSSQVRESECEWVRCVVVCGGGLCLHACKCLSLCLCLCKTGFCWRIHTLSLALRALSLNFFALSTSPVRSIARCNTCAAVRLQRGVFFFVVAFVHSLSVSRFAAGFYRATSMSMAMAMAIVVFAVLITNAKLYHRSCQ